jgi:hypothetical protein
MYKSKGGRGEGKILVMVGEEGERSGGRVAEASGNTTCLSGWRRRNWKMKFKPRQGEDYMYTCSSVRIYFRGCRWVLSTPPPMNSMWDYPPLNFGVALLVLVINAAAMLNLQYGGIVQ